MIEIYIGSDLLRLHSTMTPLFVCGRGGHVVIWFGMAGRVWLGEIRYGGVWFGRLRSGTVWQVW